MTLEDRLRDAIRARTSRVEAAPDALDTIQEKLMSRRDTTRTRILFAVGTAAAVVAAVVIGLTLMDDDDSRVDTAGTPTSEDTTTTTSVVAAESVVFPDPSTSRRFDDPRALVTVFATELLGYTDPIVGELFEGDSRSGEIEVRSFDGGPPMTVAVRQLEEDSWFALGASTESIRLDTPAAGATISSPQALEGAALAFEGTVDVRLYADGVVEPIARTFVTGGGDEVRPFSGELTFEAPDGVEHGVLVLSEASAEDGSTLVATVIRVHF